MISDIGREGFVLTEEADNDRAEFLSDYADGGCSCFISPPCSYCVHPGNPNNQVEDDNCWVPE